MGNANIAILRICDALGDAVDKLEPEFGMTSEIL